MNMIKKIFIHIFIKYIQIPINLKVMIPLLNEKAKLFIMH